MTNYLHIRDQITSFTLVNCVPRGLFWSMIGHTAMLYKSPQTGQISVFESTTRGKGKSGVRLTPFGQWLAEYNGKVYLRKPHSPEPLPVKQLEEYIRLKRGTSYPDLSTWSGRLKLAFAAIDFNLFGRDIFQHKADGIFCTELVVGCLKYCGLFNTENPAEFEPDDTRGKVRKFESNLDNIVYGDEVRMK